MTKHDWESDWEREYAFRGKMLRKNRFAVVPPFWWYGPDPEPQFDSLEEKLEYISEDMGVPIEVLERRAYAAVEEVLDDEDVQRKEGWLRRTLDRIRFR